VALTANVRAVSSLTVFADGTVRVGVT
jgi:hypothetical protein